MIPLKDNQDVASFLVTKHSWKGKYKRVFAVGTHGLTTYNPDRLEVTNKWLYADVVTIASAKHSNSAPNHDFTLVMKKDKKVDTMKFSSEHKCLILTEAFKYRHLFAEKPKDIFRYQAYKHHWSGTRLPVVLEVGPCALDQLDPSTHTLLASYPYCDIQGILPLRDIAGGFVLAVGGYSRLHLFSDTSADHQRIINKMLEMANLTLTISIKVLSTTITLEDYFDQRFGKYSGDEHQTSLSEFLVHKVRPARHMEPMRRTLCLSDTCVLERDPQTYSVVCLRPLCDVFALVRDEEHPQKFSIEYLNGQTRTYLAGERDALLASLLDGVRGAGQRDVHVRSTRTPRGYRLGPLHHAVGEETEANHLRLFQNPVGMSRAEVVDRFNANVAYSGLIYSVSQDGAPLLWLFLTWDLRLFAENKEKLISGALSALVGSGASAGVLPLRELEAQFHALRRLCASKVGFAAFTALPGFREWVGTSVVAALRRGSAACSNAALDAVCALMQPMHAEPDLRQEQLNKASMLSSPAFLESLLAMWAEHVSAGTGALVVAAMLDFLTFALCVPYSETTDGKQFDQLLEMVANRGRVLFKLFEHPSLAIVKGAGLVTRALVEEGCAAVGARMQALALAEAALPRHLLAALYAPARLHHRHLARHLLALWAAEHAPAHSLLRRLLPSGLLAFLESTEAPPAAALEEDNLEERDNLQLAQATVTVKPRAAHWEALERQVKYVEKHLEHYASLALQHWMQRGGAGAGALAERREGPRPVVLRRRRERIKSTANWPLFYYHFHRDHALPNLIWNHTTREELRAALESEVRAFAAEREAAGGVLTAWNHAEMELHYHCLQNEVKIGDYYLRILLEQRDNDDSPIRKSYEFFNELYHRFLSTPKVEMKCMCLQAMSIVYGKYHEDIGPFADTKYIVQMLDRTCDKMERDRLVQFLSKLILHKRNVSELLEWNGIRILVELMTLAHLHTSRALVPTQSNVLEGPAPVPTGGDREWFYNLEQGDKVQRMGPVSFQQLKELYQAGSITNKTKCWANSMEGWRAVGSVPQLKWSLLARGTAVLDESALAATVLDLLITATRYFPSRDEEDAVVRPLPRVKRLLSEPATLAHLVQLLLTFDPVLVEKVASLLYEVMQDNPEVSKLYLTGVFYFMLLYTGSNLLPIARFLRLTHMKQAFRADQSTSDIMQRSILGQLLPEAMVCYLENHGAEKFAQIFLGEWDTPEAIWNSEMRRMLIMKVSAHIGEFTPRLRAHVAARYPYLAIPAVRYVQLQRELFCSMFYLRHLCDTARFPDWPIPDPVRLLKDVLEAWRREVEKEPPSMTAAEAYAALGLSGTHDEAAVRKAYYRLAQQYHPDKNPDGRERFEAVNQAYEFLCSRTAWASVGPDTNNIVLILRTQTILFQRYSQELAPYKYAGYPQLLRTVRLEAEAEQLFAAQDAAALLPAACRLAHATVTCSALNAEELRREGGLEVLHEALSRCVAQLAGARSSSELAAAVCAHVARCFAVAASFPACREVLAARPALAADIVPLLRRQHLGDTACAGAEAIASLAADPTCRSQLARAGAIHALLPAVLQYDYTLTEAGLEAGTPPSKQEVCNQLAKQCVVALGALYGPHEHPAPDDSAIQHALHTLLTPYLCAKLANTDQHELLKTLTSNWKTPYLVWDNSTRAELREALQQHRAPQEEGPLVAPLEYSAHRDLLAVGGVYLHIYNDQPDFTIQNPQQFILELLQFALEQTREEVTPEKVEHMTLALDALANVIIKNPGTEIQCIGHFGLIFGVMSARARPGLQAAALRVVLAAAGSRECVEDIAASTVLGHLLQLLGDRPPRPEALAALSALLAAPPLVKEALHKGGVIYLLELFCNSKVPETRSAAAELLARMMQDKLHGPKVRLAISRYIPGVFADAMRDGGAAPAVHMFDSNHAHPELVWGDEARLHLKEHIAALRDRHQAEQLRDANAAFEDREGAGLGAGWAPPGEVVVGGVYLKLYLQHPAWNLRQPKLFLQELLAETVSALSKDASEDSRGSTCAAALRTLVVARPALGEACAALGELPRLVRLAATAPRHMVPVLAALAATQACVAALTHTEVMSALKSAIKTCRECVGSACEALAAIFLSTANTDRLVLQALETDLIGELLSLLESRLEGQTAAQLVNALKAMCRSPLHGERVRQLLARSRVWEQYAAQRHDLFISSAPAHHSLTGPLAPTAGYLTAPPTTLAAQPPPLD